MCVNQLILRDSLAKCRFDRQLRVNLVIFHDNEGCNMPPLDDKQYNPKTKCRDRRIDLVVSPQTVHSKIYSELHGNVRRYNVCVTVLVYQFICQFCCLSIGSIILSRSDVTLSFQRDTFCSVHFVVFFSVCLSPSSLSQKYCQSWFLKNEKSNCVDNTYAY